MGDDHTYDTGNLYIIAAAVIFIIIVVIVIIASLPRGDTQLPLQINRSIPPPEPLPENPPCILPPPPVEDGIIYHFQDEDKKSGRFVSKGEKICCSVMEKAYNKPFTSIRPDFLKNPETGRNLELDCYNPELRYAVEYNGIQHYQYTKKYHKKPEDFENQIKRDHLKADLCEKNGVYLITVPYSVALGDIEAYIRRRLPESIDDSGSSEIPIAEQRGPRILVRD